MVEGLGPKRTPPLQMLHRMFDDSVLMLISLLISDSLFKVFVDQY